MKRFSLVVCVFLLLFGIASCGNMAATPVDVSVGKMKITLTNEFSVAVASGYTARFISSAVEIDVLREDYEKFDAPEEMSLEEYASMILANNGKELAVSKDDGLTSFLFEESVGSNRETHFVSVYCGDAAFWMVQFICESSSYAGLKDSFETWAGSVRFQ